MRTLSVLTGLLVLVVMIFSQNLYAGSGKESAVKELPIGSIVRLSGRIRIKGNEPFTRVVLEDEDGWDYVLVGDKTEQLRQEFQLKMMRIRGRVIFPGDEIRLVEVEVLSFKIVVGG